MKTLLAALLLTATLTAQPVIARHTGRSQLFTTVTGQSAVNCEYEIPGQKFWKAFLGMSCPATVDVQ